MLMDGNLEVRQIFIKTGVLTVESTPFLQNLYIDGEPEGEKWWFASRRHRISLSEMDILNGLKMLKLRSRINTNISLVN